jgi:SEC-C motif-containing protein
MRSRFSAFALGELDYLRDTWHEDFRPEDLTLDPRVHWIGLEILAESQRGDMATVEFEARFLRDGRVDAMHERSDFRYLRGRWYYTHGESLPPHTKSWKPARNETCPCGSGRKFKRCCAGSSRPQAG